MGPSHRQHCRKKQAKQQRLSGKYKLPSWSPSSTGRKHSCKKEKKQRWATGSMTITSFLSPVTPRHLCWLTTRLKWKDKILPFSQGRVVKHTDAHSFDYSQRNTDKSRQKSSLQSQHTFLFIGLWMQHASKARAEEKSLLVRQGSLFMSSLRCLWSTFTKLWVFMFLMYKQWQPL